MSSKKRVGFGLKIIGGLALAAAGAGYLYRRGQQSPTVALPKALESDLVSFNSEAAGELCYYVDRLRGGRPLLLIHSISAASSSFEMRPLFEHYRSSRPVYAIDLPGFGFSERRADRAYVPEVMTQAIIELIDTQIGTAVDVVVLSLSSEFVARAAMLRPDLFHSLTLVNPTGFRAKQREFAAEKLYRFFSLPKISKVLFALLTRRKTIKYYSDQSFVGEAANAFVDYAYMTSHQPGARFAPLYFLSTWMFTWNILPTVYQKLTTPTMVLYDEDPNVTFETLPNLVASHENWYAERVAPSMGLPHWEMLGQVTAVLDTFWER